MKERELNEETDRKRRLRFVDDYLEESEKHKSEIHKTFKKIEELEKNYRERSAEKYY